MSNITVGRILLLDLVFLVNSALTLVVFKFVGSYIILAYFMFWIYPQILEDRENNDDDK